MITPAGISLLDLIQTNPQNTLQTPGTPQRLRQSQLSISDGKVSFGKKLEFEQSPNFSPKKKITDRNKKVRSNIPPENPVQGSDHLQDGLPKKKVRKRNTKNKTQVENQVTTEILVGEAVLKEKKTRKPRKSKKVEGDQQMDGVDAPEKPNRVKKPKVEKKPKPEKKPKVEKKIKKIIYVRPTSFLMGDRLKLFLKNQKKAHQLKVEQLRGIL